jgi:hypothetical protein
MCEEEGERIGTLVIYRNPLFVMFDNFVKLGQLLDPCGYFFFYSVATHEHSTSV